jgi:hypothetical protein
MKYLNQFLKRSDSLDRLRLSALQLATLTRRIRAALPGEFASHIVGCAPKTAGTPGGDTLVVLVDSAAWASQLRYVQHDILSACRTALNDRIRNVQFKILPPEAPPPPSRTVTLSDTTRHLLQRSADGIADEALANALRRLGRRRDQDAG